MDRDRALPLALALLAIVALALSAATLDSAVVPEGASGFGGDDRGFGDDRPEGGASTADGSVGDRSDARALPFSPCWPVLREPAVLAGYGLLLVGLFAAVYRSTRSAFAGVVVCGGVTVPFAFLWAAFAFCGPPPGATSRNGTTAGAANGSRVPEGGAGGLGNAGAETLSSPTVLLVLLVVVALAVVGVAVLATGRDDGAASGPGPESEPDDATDRIGRVAGTAADRIDAEDPVDADNEVYRAWQRMTDALDVDSPETTTPREFERAAVDAGMARDDVAALTSLFEAVRYGGREATADAEERAVGTLRRIEAGYGGE